MPWFVETMSESIGRFVGDQIAEAKAEAVEKTKQSAKGAGLLGAAGALAVVSLGGLVSLVVIALRRLLPGWLIALGVAGGAGGGAYVLGRRGLSELESAAPPAVQQAVGTVKDRVVETVEANVPLP
jgi:hypothetical protein